MSLRDTYKIRFPKTDKIVATFMMCSFIDRNDVRENVGSNYITLNNVYPARIQKIVNDTNTEVFNNNRWLFIPVGSQNVISILENDIVKEEKPEPVAVCTVKIGETTPEQKDAVYQEDVPTEEDIDHPIQENNDSIKDQNLIETDNNDYDAQEDTDDQSPIKTETDKVEENQNPVIEIPKVEVTPVTAPVRPQYQNNNNKNFNQQRNNNKK